MWCETLLWKNAFKFFSKKRGMNGLILGERQKVGFDGVGLLEAGPARGARAM